MNAATFGSEEEAFLAGIEAVPDDDDLRLVYADWLDDNGHADRADYLRIVHSLTAEPVPDRATMKRVMRLRAVARRTDEVWRERAGRRFDVLVEGWMGGAILMAVRAVRWLTAASVLNELRQNEERQAVVIRGSLLREAAEDFVSTMDRERFRRKRNGSAVYRIVPAPVRSLATAE